MTTELATKPKTISDLQSFVATRIKQIKSVIASNLTPEKMARIALNELRNSDYLAKCAIQNPDSFINSIVQASHLGLEIGGALGQAYLVPFKGEIKMMPGYRGLISLARRSGEITSINAEIVYDQDEFDLSLGLEAKVTHKPKIRGGPRKGAGRKPLPPHLKKRNVTVRVTPATLEWLKEQDKSYSRIINQIIADHLYRLAHTKQKEEK